LNDKHLFKGVLASKLNPFLVSNLMSQISNPSRLTLRRSTFQHHRQTFPHFHEPRCALASARSFAPGTSGLYYTERHLCL